MKYLLLPLIVFVFACGGNEDTRAAARKAAEAKAVTTASLETVQKSTVPDMPDPSLGLLTLQAPEGNLGAGKTGCFEVVAKGFKDLLSMQYTIKWNPEVIQFKEVKAFNLPGLTAQNFGQNRLAQGLLPVVWIDNSLQGVTRADGTALYEICFAGTGKAGMSSRVEFVEQPTPFEVVNINTKVIPLEGLAGGITIE